MADSRSSALGALLGLCVVLGSVGGVPQQPAPQRQRRGTKRP